MLNFIRRAPLVDCMIAANQMRNSLLAAIYSGNPPRVYKSLWWVDGRKPRWWAKNRKPKVWTRYEVVVFPGIHSLISTAKE